MPLELVGLTIPLLALSASAQATDHRPYAVLHSRPVCTKNYGCADGWGFFVRVDEGWGKEDEMKISSIFFNDSGKARYALHKAAAHPDILGTTLQQGWPGLASEWAEDPDFLSSCKKFFAVELEIHTKTWARQEPPWAAHVVESMYHMGRGPAEMSAMPIDWEVCMCLNIAQCQPFELLLSYCGE